MAEPHRVMRPSVDEQKDVTIPVASYQFGHIKLPPSQVFYVSPTKLSYATVNLKPVLPGMHTSRTDRTVTVVFAPWLT